MRQALIVAALMATAWAGATTPARAAGSWVADLSLEALRHRGRPIVSAPARPRDTTPLNGDRITRMAWRYAYDRLPTPYMTGRLCSPSRCVAADRPQGSTDDFAGQAVTTPFRLVLSVPGRGRLRPPLRAGRGQIVVNFE